MAKKTVKKTVKKTEAPVKCDTPAGDPLLDLLRVISKQLENFGNVSNQISWLINEHHALVQKHNEIVGWLNNAFFTDKGTASTPTAVAASVPAVKTAPAVPPVPQIPPQVTNGSAVDQKTNDMGF